MNIKGAIFDFDGTLYNSMYLWENVGSDYLKSLGITPKPGLREDLKPLTLIQTADYFIAEYGVTLAPEKIVAGINKIIEHYYLDEVMPKDGIRELLQHFKSTGVKMCVATATDHYLVKAALERCGLLHYFETVLTCTIVGSSKNEPVIFDRALELLGTDKTNTIIFEDAYHAIMTAKNAGYMVACIEDAFEIHGKELEAMCDYYIKDIKSCIFLKGCEKYEIKKVLTIAGSDCSGGAGIQADIKTIAAHKMYAMSAITALTAQNTTGVYGILEATPEFLANELDCIFTDIFPESVKIGMVSSTELIKVIAQKLKQYNVKNIVLDPVMVSTSGHSLLSEDAIDVLTSYLMPLATVITPNIPEAQVLCGYDITADSDMIKAAKDIYNKYHTAVLIKGGHKINDATDLLYDGTDTTWFSSERVNNPNTHGTGCTLSSAIACSLADGYSLPDSISNAKKYLTGALKDMMDLGKGSGPLNHQYRG